MPQAQGCAGAVNVKYSLHALRPGHGLVTLFRCFVLFRLSQVAFPAPGGCHMTPVFAVRSENTVKTCEIHSWLGHQRGQLGNKIQRLEDDIRGAITVGVLS